MKIFLIVILIFVLSFKGVAEKKNDLKMIKVPYPVCEASGKVEKSFVPPPAEYFLKSGEPTADIIVTYVGFTDAAKAAVEKAVTIWESLIVSDMPIRMHAKWSVSSEPNTLASCGPETYYANFRNAPFKDCYYPVAIAEKIAGEELNGTGRYDMEASFNSAIKWYYGTDGQTPSDSYDLVTVALHEIAHGLGFTGFFYVDTEGLGGYGYYSMGDATSYDLLVESFSAKKLLDKSLYDNPSVGLKTVLTSNSLYAGSPVAKANGGTRPRLYAPVDFDGGSSIYHLNDNTYASGTTNALMTHAIGYGEANHNPGPLALGMMEDSGWTNLLLKHTPVKDKEQIEPLDFVINVDSYYEIPSNKALVIYSTDNFASVKDTLVLLPGSNAGDYEVSYQPAAGTTDIQYYIQVADSKLRTRTSPWNAPAEVHHIHFGTDTELPTITHVPIDYFLDNGEALSLTAEVDDNLGLDTVYVTYSINGIQQPSFGLMLTSEISFSGEFPFNTKALNDGDVISYQIVARDASVAKNTAVYPTNEPLEFKVEKIFDPIVNYANDFNSATSDFILSDFDIYTAANFSNGALHSPHPYPSPNVDNKDFNFTTLLKRPIILQQEGTIAFDEVVLVEPGTGSYGGDSFWDYVVVEGSKDQGKTWHDLANGYDSGSNPTWEQQYKSFIVDQESQAQGSADMFVYHEIQLLQNGFFAAGDTIWIRFRLYSDPYANGWGWVIDNLRIQQPVSAPVTVLSPGNVNIYPNPFKDQFQVQINPSEQIGELQIDVFDSLGRNLYSIVHRNVSNQVEETIDLSDKPAGMFLVRISEDGKGVLSKKLIKN